LGITINEIYFAINVPEKCGCSVRAGAAVEIGLLKKY
jgi:hypothetical protein